MTFRRALEPSANPYSGKFEERRYVAGWQARAFGEPIDYLEWFAWLDGWMAADIEIRAAEERSL